MTITPREPKFPTQELTPPPLAEAVREVVSRGQTFSTVGLGAVISRATDGGNFQMLMAATLVMAIIVVTINRMLWRRLYTLAATRFKLEA
jgi:ABC-type anion transport system duplicated permease subunit